METTQKNKNNALANEQANAEIPGPVRLAAHEVQTSVKFENSLSRLWGEG